MKKDVSMFSKEELAALNMFVKQAAIEDKKLHGITTDTKKPVGQFYNQDKAKTFTGNNNKLNQKKEEKKPPPHTIKKVEPKQSSVIINNHQKKKKRSLNNLNL